MSRMTDPRSAVVYRIPAAALRPGDLVDTAANGNEWQEVLHVFARAEDVTGGAGGADAEALRDLVRAADGRYVVVQLTDIAPVDSGVFFEDGVAMAAGEDDDQPVSEVIGSGSGLRTYVYTKYELVTVRGQG
jgi:choline dehydrogenase-like flavoprotein